MNSSVATRICPGNAQSDLLSGNAALALGGGTAQSLPPLKVAIYQNGELQKVTTIPDPRNALCEAIARDFGDLGMSARPVVEGGDTHE